MSLQVGDEPSPVEHVDVDRFAPSAVAEGRPAAVVQEAARQDVREHVERSAVGQCARTAAEVLVVALRLTGQRNVQPVVDVIGPLRRHPESTVGCGRDHRRVVEVALGDQVERSAELIGQCRNGIGELDEQVPLPLVDERVDGVKAQGVDVEVTQPAQRVLDDERTDLFGPGGVEIDGWSPRGQVCLREVGAEPAEVVPARSEVVVDDVKADSEPATVARIDEPLEAGRPTEGVVDGIQVHPVVAPTRSTRDRRDGQHLDDINPEVDKVVQPLDGCVEGALAGERPDVQLVDDSAEGARTVARAAPGAVGPLVGGGIEQATRSVDAVRLPGAARVRESRLVAVEDERIVKRGVCRVVAFPAPPAPVATHHGFAGRGFARRAEVDLDAGRFGCPDLDHDALTNRATGRSSEEISQGRIAKERVSSTVGQQVSPLALRQGDGCIAPAT